MRVLVTVMVGVVVKVGWVCGGSCGGCGSCGVRGSD